MKIEIPKRICKKCKRKIKDGELFCYECMMCGKCSPKCYEAGLTKKEAEEK